MAEIKTLQDLFDFVAQTNAFLQVFGTDQFNQMKWDVEVGKLRKTLLEELGTRKDIWHLPRGTELPAKSKRECRKLVRWCGEGLLEPGSIMRDHEMRRKRHKAKP